MPDRGKFPGVRAPYPLSEEAGGTRAPGSRLACLRDAPGLIGFAGLELHRRVWTGKTGGW